MKKSPSFQFYAQDFLTGVIYLTNEEIGIYIKMLCKQWTDGNIPKKRLGFLVGIDWDNFSDELKSKFTDLGTHILNERLEIEREKKEKFIKKQSENGKKGGRPSKESSIKTIDETQNKPNPFKKQKPNKNQKKPLEDEIEIEIEEEKEKEKGGVGEKTNPINSKFLKDVEIDQVPENEKYFFEVAKSFYGLFVRNLAESGAPTAQIKKTKYASFVKPIRLMVEKDGITSQHFEKLFLFLQKDPFWKTKILGTLKLREHAPKLIIQANGKKDTNTGGATDEFRRKTAERLGLV